jgi:uncharacterized protein YjbI with pentapeptide repeats
MLQGANLHRADLSHADLREADLSDAILDGTELTGAQADNLGPRSGLSASTQRNVASSA